MITFSSNTSRFNKVMRSLADHVNVSTGKFVKNESRLMSQELAKRFTPKQKKAEKGIEVERRIAYRIGRTGKSQIPWQRLRNVIRGRQRTTKGKVTVAAAVAVASQKKAIQRLGTMAAGFIGRGNNLEVSGIKPFVMRNVQRCYGMVKMQMGLLTKRVIIINKTPWMGDMKGLNGQVKKAINTRTSSMRTNLRLIAQGVKQYWNESK